MEINGRREEDEEGRREQNSESITEKEQSSNHNQRNEFLVLRRTLIRGTREETLIWGTRLTY